PRPRPLPARRLGRCLDRAAPGTLARRPHRRGVRRRAAAARDAAGGVAGRAPGARRRTGGRPMSTFSAPVPARDYGTYRVWAPAAQQVSIRVDGAEHTMREEREGWFTLPEVPATPGARYAFRLDDSELWLPDPRSLSQPDGVHADSEVVDPTALREEISWAGRHLRGRVLYELHVGTFTPGPDGRGGTFDSAIGRLDELVGLGVDAVELMPVAPFPGDRGWGYDGVGLYGTHAAYGGPAGLARFVAAAHRRGLAVVLDVVHNHLGPAGNYLGLFGPYFTD